NPWPNWLTSCGPWWNASGCSGFPPLLPEEAGVSYSTIRISSIGSILWLPRQAVFAQLAEGVWTGIALPVYPFWKIKMFSLCITL
ncbi:MAG: hypothetical protein ABDK92_06930, partial [Atribacterota bacterium]